MSSKRHVAREFRIKLLSGNNVVLVEASGCESEIFVPEIVNGRITFLNIIPERRCCSGDSIVGRSSKKHARLQQQLPLPIDIANMYASGNTPINGLSMNDSSNNNNNNKERLGKQSTQSWRAAAGQDDGQNARHTPMAYHSTPVAKRRGENKENEPPGFNNNSYATPQAARCAANAAAASLASASVPTPYQVLRDTHVPIPPGIKLVRLYRNQSPSQPKRLTRVVTLNIEDSSEPTDTSKERILSSSLNPPNASTPADNTGSFNLPPTPEFHNSWRLANVPEDPQTKNKKTQAPAPKWRKCITPIRTYSRRRGGAGGDQAFASSATDKAAAAAKRTSKQTHNFIYAKVIPTYLVNPTQGVPATHVVRVRKRKLIMDSRLELSPPSIKQQPAQSRINNGKSEQQPHENSPSSGKSKRRRLKNTLPATRKTYEQSKMAAFDLLTNPSRSLSMSKKLVQQFRKGCINKAASSYPKYKQLAMAPSIPGSDSDESEISTISE